MGEVGESLSEVRNSLNTFFPAEGAGNRDLRATYPL